MLIALPHLTAVVAGALLSTHSVPGVQVSLLSGLSMVGVFALLLSLGYLLLHTARRASAIARIAKRRPAGGRSCLSADRVHLLCVVDRLRADRSKALGEAA